MSQLEERPPAQSFYKTRFYSDCLGVFQGGGCRVAAFAGAYSAAYESGVRFSEVAGTSGGALVAALIAAGAEPEYLLGEVRALKFPEMLSEAQHSLFDVKQKTLQRLWLPCGGEMGALLRIALRGGRYSSQPIEVWLESKLREILNLQKRIGFVRFEELTLPLYVVASDLSTMRPRIWSARDTPTASVAHAVRASCSIPFFYQPVEEGSTLLVDGGLVSNLPHFVFFHKEEPEREKRVLCFALEADEPTGRPVDAPAYMRRLVSLSIDGATDVQLRLQTNIGKVFIHTGSVQATDMDRMDLATVDALIEKGKTATDSFIRQELRGATKLSISNRILLDEHQAFLSITEQITAVRRQAVISFRDTRWFWELFPTVLYWRRQGIRLYCFTLPVTDDSVEASKERQRRYLMEQMGVHVIESTKLSFHGIMVDSGNTTTSCALVFGNGHSDYEPIARFYGASTDSLALSSIYDRIKTHLPQSLSEPPAVTLVAIPPAEIIKLLKSNVRQYRASHVELSLERVEVKKILLISRFVRAFRYQQISTIVEAYREKKLPLFSPMAVQLADGTSSIITPPVLEVLADGYVALEGNTRSLYCVNNGIEFIDTIVVRGVTEALPGRAVPLKQVRITSYKRRPEERIDGLDRDLFRDIERAVRPLKDDQ